MSDSTVQNTVPQDVPNNTPPVVRPGTPESEAPMSGFMKSQADMMRDSVPVPEEPTGYNLEELSQKLGVDPNTLGTPPVPEVQEPPAPVNPDDWYKNQFKTPEALEFVENFKKYVGFDIKEVYKLIQDTAQTTQGVEQWRREVHAERQLATIKQELGQEFDSIMPQVLQRFNQIRQTNPQQAQALDNIDGVRMLAALIRQEGRQSSVTNNPSIPQFYPNRRPANHGVTNQSPVIKMSDFINWSDADVQARMPEIIRAKQEGRFIHDL